MKRHCRINHCRKNHCRKNHLILITLILIVVALAASVFGQRVYAAKKKATTIRLVKTEGNVVVKNSNLEEQVLTEDMRLFSGDHQITDSASYAWLSLDDSKAVKLDENSETELRKKWKKLEVLLDSGSIFFNVTVPLAKDESLNIRSATLITGVRGTCGWVRVMDGGDTRVYLLEGKLECLVTNPMTGESKNITLKPGQYADFIVYDAGTEGEKTVIVPGTFGKDDIEPFVLEELIGDDELINKIYEQSGIDLRNLKKDDVSKKKRGIQEEQANTKNGIRGKAAKQDGIVSKDPVWDEKGDGDNNSIVYLTMPQTAATVQRYLDDVKVKKVVLLPGEVSEEENTLKIDMAFRAPMEKTLETRDGVAVVVEDKKSLVVDGTAIIKDALTNNGTLTVNSFNTLRVGDVITNHGLIENTGTGHIVIGKVLISDGVLKNAGLIEQEQGMQGESLIVIYGGDFQISGGKIVATDYKTVLEVKDGMDISLDLSGGSISNDKDGGTTIRVSTEDFHVAGMGTDVMGVTDTLLGEEVDLTLYEAATVWRTDERYHLIALSLVESYPVVVVQAEHGSISAPGRVEVGAGVPLIVLPDEGYELESLAVNLYDGNKVGATVGVSADHVFTMPRSNVIVSGKFRKIGEKQTDPDEEKIDDVTVENGKAEFGVTVRNMIHGTVRLGRNKAKENDAVSIFVTPEVGYELESLAVTTEGGKAVSYSGSETDYSFVMPAENVAVTASFRARKYVVTFLDTDGKTVLSQQELGYGTTPAYGGRSLSRASTSQYDYNFAGWKNGAGAVYRSDVPLPGVTGNETYTAQYNLILRTYAVTFYDEDGTTQLRKARFSYGAIPSYGDDVPAKMATPQYAYDFTGWSDGTNLYAVGTNLPTVNGDKSFSAVFTSRVNVCDVIWQDEDGTVLEEDAAVSYGSAPSYDGNVPTKTGDAQYGYTFDGWTDGSEIYRLTDDLPMVTQAVTYTAIYRQTINTYTVVWKDENGNVLETDDDVSYGTVANYDGAMPTKAEDYSYQYAFDYWTDGTNSYSATMPQVVGDLTLTAVYGATPIHHVTGVALSETAMPLLLGGTNGMLTAILTPADATKQGVTWTSSNDSVAEVVGDGLNATVTAKSNGVAIITVTTDDEGLSASCTVTVSTAVTGITLDRTTATVILGTTENLTAVISPETASNKGITWSSNNPAVATVAAGNLAGTAVITPVSEGTARITVTAVDGGFTAGCDVTVAGYQVTWKDEDGTILRIDTAVAKGAIPAYGTNPSKANTAKNSYQFRGWTNEVRNFDADESLPQVEGNVTYRAIYLEKINQYEVTFVDDNNTVLKDATKYDYGTKAAMITCPDNPTKGSNAQYDFTFAGWTDGTGVYDSANLPDVTGNVTYKATYSNTKRRYGVTFKDYDGSVLLAEKFYDYGTAAADVTKPADPTRATDGNYIYSFTGWTPAVTAVTGNVVYTATYGNTAVVHVTGVSINEKAAGLSLMIGGTTTGTLTACVAPSDATNPHVSWSVDDPSVLELSENENGDGVSVTALKAGRATVTVTTEDGLKTDEMIIDVGAKATGVSLDKTSLALIHGKTETITAIISPVDCTDQNVTWSCDPADVITITPDDANPLKAVITTQKAGTTNLTVTTRDGGFTASCPVTVTGYTLTFKNGDTAGTVLDTQTGLAYLAPAEFLGDARPAKDSTPQYDFVFDGWTDGQTEYHLDQNGKVTLPNVTGDVVYVALYQNKLRNYAVTWKNMDGSVLGTETLDFGTTPVYKVAGSVAEPAYASTAQYDYHFKGWLVNGTFVEKTQSLPAIEGVTEIKAQYEPVIRTYSVVFYDENRSTELDRQEDVAFGTAITYKGGAPTKDSTTEQNFAFDGWDDKDGNAVVSLGTVTGEMKFYARYTPSTRKYSVTFVDDDGVTILKTAVEYDYGTAAADIEKPASDPAKAMTEEYEYTFNGWSPALSEVKGNVTYKATYGARKRVTGVTMDKSSITLTMNLVLQVPVTETLTATVAPADASNLNVKWESSDTSVCTVNEDDERAGVAVVTAVNPGTATITAKSMVDDKSATCLVTVTYAVNDVSLSENTMDLLVGGSDGLLTASITPVGADNQNVSWRSDDTSVVTVTGDGLSASVHAVGNGTANVYVTTEDGGHEKSCAVTVRTAATGITLNKTSATVILGTTEDVSATVEPDTASNKNVTWTTDDSSVATVAAGNDSATARITPVGVGTAKITATTEDGGFYASCEVTVAGYTVVFQKEDGTVLDTHLNVPYQTRVVYEGTGAPSKDSTDKFKYIFDGWTDGTTEYRFDADGNLNLPEIVDDTVYTALFEEELRNYAVVFYDEDGRTVLNEQPSVAYDTDITYQGTAPTKDSTDALTFAFVGWTDETGALLASLGTVSGDMKFYANYEESVRKYSVTFLDEDGTSVLLDAKEYDYNTAAADIIQPATPTKAMTEEYEYTFNAWTPALADVTSDVRYKASYDERKRVTGLTLDKTEITLNINRYAAAIPSATILATITPADASDTSVTFESSDLSVAKVTAGDQPGEAIVTPVGAGTAVITARSAVDDKSATCEVTVRVPVTRISLNHTGYTAVIGGADGSGASDFVLKATITPGDATNQEVTWTSSDDTIATVTQDASDGLQATVHPVKNGDVNIIAETKDGGYRSICAVTVQTNTTGVAFANDTEQIYLGTTGNTLSVTVSPETASNKTVSWESSAPAVATVTVDANDSTKATINPVGLGTTTLTVTTENGNHTDTCVVTVKGYKAVFKNYDGRKLQEDELAYGATPTYDFRESGTPSKASSDTHNYVFAGFTDGTKNYAMTASGCLEELDPITGDMEYTAYYTEVPRSFNVTLDLNVPENVTGDALIAAGKEVTSHTYGTVTELPAIEDVTLTGYRFTGWYKTKTPTANDPVYTEISASTHEEQTFYAKWEKTYNAALPTNVANGLVTSPKNTDLLAGEEVVLEVAPDSSYELTEMYYAASEGGAVTQITKNADGKYVFVMPAYDVDVSAAFNWLHDLYYTVDAATGTLTLYRHQSADKSRIAQDRGVLSFAGDPNIMKIVIAEEISPLELASAFANCSTVTTIENMDLLNLEDATDLSELFSGCTALTSVDFSGLDLSKVENMENMFYGCTSLTSVDFTNTKVEKVKNMKNMFYDCTNLTSVDLSGFDTASVTSISGIFTNCTALTEVNLSGLDMSGVTNMADLFKDCTSLKNANLAGMDTSNVTDMSGMFSGCQALVKVDLTDINTANVTTMREMFNNCMELSTVDLGSFDTSKVESTYNMFYYCMKLTKIYASETFVTDGLADARAAGNMFHYCIKLVGGNGTRWMYRYGSGVPSDARPYACLDTDENEGFFTKSGARETDPMYYLITEEGTDNVLTIYASYEEGRLPFTNGSLYCCECSGTTEDGTLLMSSNVTKIVIAEKIKPNNMNNAFAGMSNVTTIEGLEKIDTSGVRSMKYCFGYDSLLTGSLDLSTWDTSNVRDMSYMFAECEMITGIKMAANENPKLVFTNSMFWACGGLINLDLTGFKTPNVTSMGYMFDGCRSLSALTVSEFDTSHVTDMKRMFNDCAGLSTLDLNGWDTSKVTDMCSMFGGMAGLSTFDMSVLNTSSVTDFSYLFYQAKALTSVNLSGIDTSQAMNMSCMFAGCSSLETLDLSDFDTSNVTGMDYMFKGCTNLTSVNVSSFDTSKVIRMDYMFEDCTSLTTLDLSSFDTKSVTGCNGMFRSTDEDTKLTTIYVSDYFQVVSAYTSEMFLNRTALVGGTGTRYNAEYVNYSRARMDGSGGWPGYFTARGTHLISITRNTDNYCYYDAYSDDRVISNAYQVSAGRVIRVRPFGENGNEVKDIKAKMDASGEEIALTYDYEKGGYCFVMPEGDATVEITYALADDVEKLSTDADLADLQTHLDGTVSTIVVEASFTIDGDLTVPSGKTLMILPVDEDGNDVTVTIASGVTVTVEDGAVLNNLAALTNNGTIVNNGIFHDYSVTP